MSVSDRMTTQALARAKSQIDDVVQLGVDLVLIKPATKTELGDILTESTVTFKAFPVRYTPFDRKTSQKVSWAEDVDVIGYLSKKAVDTAGYTISQLQRQYKKIRVNSKTYDIKYIEYYSNFANDFLYVLVGGKA